VCVCVCVYTSMGLWTSWSPHSDMSPTTSYTGWHPDSTGHPTYY
jgi:hypothetical protein